MSGAFLATFGVFVLLMAGVTFLAIRWAVRRDRAERRRQAEAASGHPEGSATAPGHSPGRRR